MKTYIEYYDYFTKGLSNLSNEEIIERFNREVGIRAFGIARQGYLSALRNQIEKRGIDYSDVGNETVMYYGNKVDLVNNKMIKRKQSTN
jgi:hypothetical protein